ncbi:MAG TPA: hypothetical protein VFT16_04445 [Candidatus Saccharimonadales bacterium]|nr:hypothetical protein [Candidatus Saccharimonadales bacterium]
MNPNQVYYSSNSPGPSRGRRLLLVAGLLVLVGAALALFLFLARSNGENENGENRQQTKDSGEILPLNTASGFSLVAPKNMKGYARGTNFTIDVGDYTTNDNACNLQFGVAPPDELPGTTPLSIANAHLGAGTEFGSVGDDPRDGDDLILRAASGGQRYSMPTYEFEYSRDGVNYKARYAISMLAGGDRAFVRMYCANTGEAVPDASLKKITDKAKEITVQTE